MIHRNLHPDNIFIDNDGTVVLIDFSLATEITSSNVSQTDAGRLDYQGPEYHDPDGIIKDCKGDIWSLGCILFYLCTGKHAIRGKDEKEVRKKILSGFRAKIDEK